MKVEITKTGRLLEEKLQKGGEKGGSHRGISGKHAGKTGRKKDPSVLADGGK